MVNSSLVSFRVVSQQHDYPTLTAPAQRASGTRAPNMLRASDARVSLVG